MESTAQIKVFHLTGKTPEGRPLSSECYFAEDLAEFAKENVGSYVEAAIIDVEESGYERPLDPDEAYGFTNHIEWEWWKNRGVIRQGAPKRSTSIGDLVQTIDGKRWVCDHVGWTEVPS